MRMMKQHITVVVTGVVVATLVAGTALADMHGKMMDKDKPMHGKMEMKKDMPMMQGGMMGGMMKREVVPSGDGGVIIVVGNMLLKYDKDLELVKKATIEISDKDMEQMMQEMKKKCGMCRKMMQEKKTKTEKDG